MDFDHWSLKPHHFLRCQPGWWIVPYGPQTWKHDQLSFWIFYCDILDVLAWRSTLTSVHVQVCVNYLLCHTWPLALALCKIQLCHQARDELEEVDTWLSTFVLTRTFRTILHEFCNQMWTGRYQACLRSTLKTCLKQTLNTAKSHSVTSQRGGQQSISRKTMQFSLDVQNHRLFWNQVWVSHILDVGIEFFWMSYLWGFWL